MSRIHVFLVPNHNNNNESLVNGLLALRVSIHVAYFLNELIHHDHILHVSHQDGNTTSLETV